MRSRLVKLAVVVAIFAMAVPTFAAVENVKVGGDIDVIMIYRDHIGFGNALDPMNFTYMGTRVYLAADLTDNVSAMIRLINERDFGSDYLRDIEGNLIVDLAYVKLADLLAPGFDLTVGRQEIQIGEGLVVGSRYRALDYIGADIGTLALDMGQQKAFDAIKVDYAFPGSDMSISAFKAKIIETYGLTGLGIPVGDVDLYGLSGKYDNGNFCLEPYFAYLRMADAEDVDLDLMTLGARAGLAPMENLKLKLELAKQFGSAELLGNKPDFKGWAGLLGGSFSFGGEIKPTLTAAYSYFSGQDSSTDINMWIPMFPSNVASRVGKIAYPTLFQAGDGFGRFFINGTTGLQVINLGFGMNPAEKIGLGIDWFNLRALETVGGDSKSFGNEVDLSFTYAYTEDVTFGLDLGILFTGSNIEDNLGVDENPWQLIGSMKLAF